LSHSTLVSLGDSIDNDRSLTRFSTEERAIVLSVKIIPVEVTSQVLDLFHGSNTFRGGAGRPDVIQVHVAVVSLVSLKQTHGDDVKVSGSSGEGRHAVNVPVSQTISYHSSSERDAEKRRVEFGLQVLLVDLPSEVRDVNSGIRFSTNI
jgi:hypothetical protein